MDARPPTVSRSVMDTAIRISVVVLTMMAAIVHLSLLFPDPVFILNGIGYLTLLAGLYLPVPRLVPHRRVVRWALVGYATLTIVAWVAIGERTLLGYSTTVGEVALVVLLLLEARRSDHVATAASKPSWLTSVLLRTPSRNCLIIRNSS
jgi:hypothetical protein